MLSPVFQYELTKACETQRGSLVREAAEVVYTRDAAAVETLPQLRNDAIELGVVKQRGKPELFTKKAGLLLSVHHEKLHAYESENNS